MFYSQFILAKKGPLGTIWIAAHLERKLRKNQVADTDIGVSVDSILFPEVPIALRLSSHLLLGVVRIYSRKVNYLFDDCSEALLKVKQAFRSTAVDLPPEESTAPYHSITLPETFDLDDFELPDQDIFQGNYVDHHVSTREQITLQDTMEGVVYSTSQFGLDERFGDGDASQIGLDLEEELFMDKDKGAAPAHGSVILYSDVDPQASVQSMTPFDDDQSNKEIHENTDIDTENQIDGLAPDSDLMLYAHAPSTPGLVEEPNLSNVHKSLASDDRMETPDHDFTKLMAKDNQENSSSKLDGDSDAKAANGPMLIDESGPVLVDQENEQLKPHGDLTNNAEKVDGLQDTVTNYMEQSDIIVDQNNGECVEVQEIRDNAVAPGRCSFEASVVLEGPCNLPEEIITANICETVADGVAHNLETAINVEDSCFPKADMLSSNTHVLQPCNSCLNQPKISSLRSGNSVIDPNLPSEAVEECSLETPGSKKAQGEEGIEANQMPEATQLREQVDNETSGNGNLESRSVITELPVVEKLLSVPEGITPPNVGLLESTPNKDEFPVEGGEGGVDSIQTLSGKKRSFTESTITLQSLNSVESSGLPNSKRVAGSIPDDDDLLSSILVGRRSSVLKMKPTPSISEATVMKRSRSAPRASASKRKVLVDDAMVLHGDLIRQQLISTEDIRRIRKKAPCTRSEIWMIQKQFLEDEMFNEPIFTGMSAELVCLHNEVFDLSGTRVSLSDENSTSLEAAKGTELSTSPNVMIETGLEVDTVRQVIGDDLIEHPTEIVVLSEKYNSEDQAQNSQDLIKDLTYIPGLQEGSELEMEINVNHHKDGDTIEVAKRTDENVLGTVSEEKSPIILEDNGGCELVGVREDLKIDQSASLGDANFSWQTVSMEIEVANQLVSEEKSPIILDDNGGAESVGIREDLQIDQSAPLGDANFLLQTVSMEIGDRGMEENGQNQLRKNEDEVLDVMMNYDGKNQSLHDLCTEEPKGDPSFSLEFHGGLGASFNDGESTGIYPQSMDPEITSVGNPLFENFDEDGDDVLAGNNTDFLNVDDDDDDEVVQEYECMPSNEESRFLENSGWSSRTRAVAKYLQTMFDKEAKHGRKVLSMENLLAGKTRKEASRMFFETLVLKTRDYIHVEQENSFDNVDIRPRVKLMKSDF